jgi:hypothetical protein
VGRLEGLRAWVRERTGEVVAFGAPVGGKRRRRKRRKEGEDEVEKEGQEVGWRRAAEPVGEWTEVEGE